MDSLSSTVFQHPVLAGLYYISLFEEKNTVLLHHHSLKCPVFKNDLLLQSCKGGSNRISNANQNQCFLSLNTCCLQQHAMFNRHKKHYFEHLNNKAANKIIKDKECFLCLSG